MKRVLLLINFAFILLTAQAQTGSWKIKLNNKLLLAANTESETNNVKNIPAAAWKKSGSLEISFAETNLNTWRRSFLLFDEADNQLLSKDSTTLAKISLSSLKEIFTGKKEIRIYTIVSPLDPHLAIRMRRIHLCTLRLQ